MVLFNLIIIIIFLSTVSLISSQSPKSYFINCGSNNDTNFSWETFTGDDNPTNFRVSGGHKAVNNNPASNKADIYQTARVFTTKSWYELEADVNNTFVMVRLHFSPFFHNGIELSNSVFNVSVSGFPMLTSFSVQNSSDVLIKELIIPSPVRAMFRIVFTPFSRSSPAFVNAIEAIATQHDLFVDATSPHISPVGSIGDINYVALSYAYNPIYRINVGGPKVDVNRDDLRRTWVPDDPFIVNSEVAKSVEGDVNYVDGHATKYDAPDDVYKTAKVQLANSSTNVTWDFEVNKNAMFLVRAHFCDINSSGLNDTNDAFSLFIYSYFKNDVKPGDTVKGLQIPFYIDFVVDSVETAFVNVSIGTASQPAFLNGLEIMELVTNSGVVDDVVSDGKSIKKWYIVLGSVVGGVVFVLLIGFFIGFMYRKKKSEGGTKTESNNVLADILQATNGFDESLVIGKGGFGKVYRGTFPDGRKVAVKRGEKGRGQGRPEFVTEIMILSKIRHQHLVTLIGYCDEKSEMILVYEYMEKGTLQDHLYNTSKDDQKLSWNKRLEICISATRGLHYLHTGSDAGIIHRDVKSTNILLNENYIAKVADFGISLLDNMEESEMAIKGSFGYLDPEYISCMKLTQKSDVYSFGVVMLEVLCARPALDTTLPQKEANLADWAIKQIKDGMVEKIIDPYLVDEINPNSLRKYLETVEKCLKNTGDERPSMIDVLWDLEYALKLQQMVVDIEPHDDSTMNTSLHLRMSVMDRLPSKFNDDDSRVNDSVVSNYPSESQVFSQLKLDEAR
ncbi:hypothetical protein QVD17_10020 [Tagetes erecta]|uniref:Protein kinase domain-containing protein n=1 Tax=Tagetes erecta TaxID=13708 RepID=A0AAD8P5K2_TARER|nr:hypothetical protein QVD17_10020 [Tagetes erecta]